MCVCVCLSWREAVSQHLEANLRNERSARKWDNPLPIVAHNKLHWEHHKVGTKSSLLHAGSGKRTTNESPHWRVGTQHSSKNGWFSTRITNPIQNTQWVNTVRFSMCGNTHKRVYEGETKIQHCKRLWLLPSFESALKLNKAIYRSGFGAALRIM